MKQKKIIFHSIWQGVNGWETATAKQEDFDRITKIGTLGNRIVFLCISAFGESHILTGNYETT